MQDGEEGDEGEGLWTRLVQLLTQSEGGDVGRVLASRMRAVAGLIVNAMLDLVIDPKGDASSYARDLIAVSDQIFMTSKKGVVTDMSG